MLIDTDLVDLTGLTCNKIGVSFYAFQTESDKCKMQVGDCLRNQILDYYNSDVTKRRYDGAPFPLFFFFFLFSLVSCLFSVLTPTIAAILQANIFFLILESCTIPRTIHHQRRFVSSRTNSTALKQAWLP